MEAVTQAREWRQKGRRQNEQKWQEAAEAVTMFSDTIKNTLGKGEALVEESREDGDHEGWQSLARQQSGSVDGISVVSSDACSAPSVHSPGRVVRPRRNATPDRPNGWRHSGGCPKVRRERHCGLRSRCKSVNRHCCACTSMNVCCALLAARTSAPPDKPQVNDRRCWWRHAHQWPSSPTKAG